jgi:hypothetical protein
MEFIVQENVSGITRACEDAELLAALPNIDVFDTFEALFFWDATYGVGHDFPVLGRLVTDSFGYPLGLPIVGPCRLDQLQVVH